MNFQAADFHEDLGINSIEYSQAEFDLVPSHDQVQEQARQDPTQTQEHQEEEDDFFTKPKYRRCNVELLPGNVGLTPMEMVRKCCCLCC